MVLDVTFHKAFERGLLCNLMKVDGYMGELLCNIMEVDDDGSWNFVDNTYNRDTWLRFTEKNNNTMSIYIFSTNKASSGEYRLVFIFILNRLAFRCIIFFILWNVTEKPYIINFVIFGLIFVVYFIKKKKKKENNMPIP